MDDLGGKHPLFSETSNLEPHFLRSFHDLMIFPRMYLPDLATEDPWYEDWEIDQARRAAVPGVRGSPPNGSLR